MPKGLILYITIITLCACNDKQGSITGTSNDFRIEILEKGVETILSKKAEIKTIAGGFNWSEGTLWLRDQQALLFSDVPENKIYRWSEKDGLTVWLEPSGFTGPDSLDREGANGLMLDNVGSLILCQHGDRRVARMDTTLNLPAPIFSTVADRWRGKKLNSPNDAAIFNDNIYFTDPPYGLPGEDENADKEIGFSGVFRITSKGLVILVEDKLTRPNGIAFNPQTNSMYVSNSDPKDAKWMKYQMVAGNIHEGKVLYDATDQVTLYNGLPDGLKVHPSGYVFATGPGGIWVFSPTDELSARIYIPQATANCAFDDTFSHLYVAADSTVIRIELIPPAEK
ncbi:MAG: SMP-30/gluconolactonase/LRE family protein [Saprospiraceae bacterium]